MGTYLSDDGRDEKYKVALGYIREARNINKQIARLRNIMHDDDKSFGTYGDEVDAMAASAGVLDGLAQTELASIVDVVQPVAQIGKYGITNIEFNGSGVITITAVDADYTDWPTDGTLRISNSLSGNDGDYTVSSRTNGAITTTTGSTTAENTGVTLDSPNLKLEWLTATF